jgi:hypothetical protein
MVWFTGEEISTCKISGETKASAWQLPSANGPQNRDVGVSVRKPLIHGRDETVVHVWCVLYRRFQ